jgi:hypothetical protein
MSESQLTELGEEIKSRKAFLDKFYSECPPSEEGQKTHTVVFRIDCGNLSPPQALVFLEKIARVHRGSYPGWELFFIPVRNDTTSIAILNLTTMRWVKM